MSCSLHSQFTLKELHLLIAESVDFVVHSVNTPSHFLGAYPLALSPAHYSYLRVTLLFLGDTKGDLCIVRSLLVHTHRDHSTSIWVSDRGYYPAPPRGVKGHRLHSLYGNPPHPLALVEH